MLIDQVGGLAIRVTKASDYDVVRANALEDDVRFYPVVKGRRDELRSADAKVTPNRWLPGLKVQGNRFTISFDGRTLYAVTDNTLVRTSRAAL